ncbi:MAG: SRPBCC family protein, partial [Acidobacteriota bacterium]
MTFDPVHHIGGATRVVENREHDGRPAHVVVATRDYPTSAADLWDALTNPERIPRWFLPISGELRLGGRYQLQGNAGGAITACEPPQRFALTWEYGGDVSWVTVTLEPETAESTRLTLEHIAHVDPARWNQFGPGAVGLGWDMGLFGLSLHVGTREAVDPAAAAGWFASDAGKDFL